MANEKESTFKVTDRRKFNADGTPREDTADKDTSTPKPPVNEPAGETSQPADAPQPEIEQAPARSDNVVSFPGQQAGEPRAEPARAEGSGATASNVAADKPSARPSPRTPQQDAAAQ